MSGAVVEGPDGELDGRDGGRERPSRRPLATVTPATTLRSSGRQIPGAGSVSGATGLGVLGERVRPVTLAADLQLEVTGPLGELLGGGVPRGAVTVVDGPVGAGRSSLVLAVGAAATGVGEWAAVVTSGPGTFGVAAARAGGVVLERLAFVRGVPAERWAAVVASLVDGCSLVVADAPSGVRAVEARRLVARLRERRGILLTDAAWPDRAARRITVVSGQWSGLEAGDGRLAERELRVEVLARDRRVAAGRWALARPEVVVAVAG